MKQPVCISGSRGAGILLGSEIVAKSAMNAGFKVRPMSAWHGPAGGIGNRPDSLRPRSLQPSVEEGTARVLGSFERPRQSVCPLPGPGRPGLCPASMIVPVTVSSGSGAVYPADARWLKAVLKRLVYLDASNDRDRNGNLKTANVVNSRAISRVWTAGRSVAELLSPRFGKVSGIKSESFFKRQRKTLRPLKASGKMKGSLICHREEAQATW